MLVGGFNKEESQEYSKYCAILFYIDVKIVRHFIPLICDARPRVDRTPGHGRWELSYTLSGEQGCDSQRINTTHVFGVRKN